MRKQPDKNADKEKAISDRKQAAERQKWQLLEKQSDKNTSKRAGTAAPSAETKLVKQLQHAFDLSGQKLIAAFDQKTKTLEAYAKDTEEGNKIAKRITERKVTFWGFAIVGCIGTPKQPAKANTMLDKEIWETALKNAPDSTGTLDSRAEDIFNLSFEGFYTASFFKPESYEQMGYSLTKHILAVTCAKEDDAKRINTAVDATIFGTPMEAKYDPNIWFDAFETMSQSNAPDPDDGGSDIIEVHGSKREIDED